MKSIQLLIVGIACALIAQCGEVRAQGTAFTYQGRLLQGTNPAAGQYEMNFTLFDAATNGNVVGTPMTVAPLEVSNGVFTAQLDFGGSAFNGAARWLEITVSLYGSDMIPSTLSPRQPITATPYALYARNAATATTATSVPWTALTGIPPTLANANYSAGAGLSLSGSTFTLDARYTDMLYWKLYGNGGTVPGTHFLGTTDNRPLELRVNNQRALRLEPGANTTVNVLGGSAFNVIAAGVVGATVGGGGSATPIERNAVASSYSTIAGGIANVIGSNSYNAAIGGGIYNRIAVNSWENTIAGGVGNYIDMFSQRSFIGGGNYNTISPNSAWVTIAGGSGNAVGRTSYEATIGGGGRNRLGSSSPDSTISGGSDNEIGDVSPSSTIAGGASHHIGTNSAGGTVGGGVRNTIVGTDFYSTIAGGAFNTISNNSSRSTIGGGEGNSIAIDSSYNTIAGGYHNGIATSSGYSVMSGGNRNSIGAYSDHATIGGGGVNNIGSSSYRSTISGGYENIVSSNAAYSTIAGGTRNAVAWRSYFSAISAGSSNNIGTNSSFALVAGGAANTIGDNAAYATVPGGDRNFAATRAFAAGTRARAKNRGTFVWGDSTDSDIASVSTDSVTMRASGGYRLFSNSNLTTGVFLLPGDGSWTSASDRYAKENIEPVNARAVLDKVAALPLSTWNYKSQPNQVRHIGPMAQDFKAAFDVGASETGITSVDADGVALAAIQGLNEKLLEEIRQRDARISALEQRLERLERGILNSAPGR